MAEQGPPWPVQRIAYGEHEEQFGELRAPAAGAAPVPIVVLLHGGFWLSQWRLDLMDRLADDLARRGWASWNVEYRRADRHGWEAMAADVEAAVRHVVELAGQSPLDLDRVVLVGHSAGGQLAARVTADQLSSDTAVRPAVVVSLAGVVDLVEAHQRDLGEGAVPAALGGTPDDLAERYAASSPMARLPLRVPQVIVTAAGDHPDLNDMHRGYAAAARAAGDRVNEIELDGDHFTLIDPGSRLWADTVAAVQAALPAEPVPGATQKGDRR
jgi:acetyl esterase/lipase